MNDPANNPKEGLFSHTDDFIKLMEAARKYPSMNEIDLKDAQHYHNLIAVTSKDENIIPIFLKQPDGELVILSSFSNEVNDIQEGSKLVYLGKNFDIEDL
jgi:hypothetical protein